jgi:hypothetical protein
LESSKENIQQDPTRPLIFLGHSFGGLPIIHALCRSRNNPQQWGNSFQSVTGLVFFGVPFRGRDGPTIKEWVENLHKYKGKDSTFQIWEETMTTSQRGSQYLQEIFSQYTETRGVKHPIPVSCFWETLPSPVEKVWRNPDPPESVGRLAAYSKSCLSMLNEN